MSRFSYEHVAAQLLGRKQNTPRSGLSRSSEELRGLLSGHQGYAESCELSAGYMGRTRLVALCCPCPLQQSPAGAKLLSHLPGLENQVSCVAHPNCHSCQDPLGSLDPRGQSNS